MDNYDENAACLLRLAVEKEPQEIHIQTLNILSRIMSEYSDKERSTVLSALVGQIRKNLTN